MSTVEKNALAGAMIERYGGTNPVKTVEVFGFCSVVVLPCLRIKNTESH